MVTVKPFRGLRPVPEKAEQVASPPYDVLDSNEARVKASGNDLSFLHVVKPEIDLPADIDVHAQEVYAKGRENLINLINRNILIRDEKACYYVYRLQMGNHAQLGLVALSTVDDYDEKRIKVHEHTRPDKEQDRVNHIDALNAQTGPVFLTYRAHDEISRLLDLCTQQKAVYDFTADYDIRHTLYIVNDDELINKIEQAFQKVDYLYVADGHHRSAAASRVRKIRQEKNPGHTGLESYNFYLTVIFPDSQMHILDYNRVVRDLAGHTEESFLDSLNEQFEVQKHESGGKKEAYKPEKLHMFGLYLNGQWYRLTAKSSAFDENDPIDQLDVSILEKNVLKPILKIEDVRTDQRIHFVGGIRGLGELERLVNSGEYQVAFSLYPTTISQLLNVADADRIMPPKSTWFEPKLRSGLLIHQLD